MGEELPALVPPKFTRLQRKKVNHPSDSINNLLRIILMGTFTAPLREGAGERDIRHITGTIHHIYSQIPFTYKA